jgi:hypothetical protein
VLFVRLLEVSDPYGFGRQRTEAGRCVDTACYDIAAVEGIGMDIGMLDVAVSGHWEQMTL